MFSNFMRSYSISNPAVLLAHWFDGIEVPHQLFGPAFGLSAHRFFLACRCLPLLVLCVSNSHGASHTPATAVFVTEQECGSACTLSQCSANIDVTSCLAEKVCLLVFTTVAAIGNVLVSISIHFPAV